MSTRSSMPNRSPSQVKALLSLIEEVETNCSSIGRPRSDSMSICSSGRSSYDVTADGRYADSSYCRVYKNTPQKSQSSAPLNLDSIHSSRPDDSTANIPPISDAAFSKPKQAFRIQSDKHRENVSRRNGEGTHIYPDFHKNRQTVVMPVSKCCHNNDTLSSNTIEQPKRIVKKGKKGKRKKLKKKRVVQPESFPCVKSSYSDIIELSKALNEMNPAFGENDYFHDDIGACERQPRNKRYIKGTQRKKLSDLHVQTVKRNTTVRTNKSLQLRLNKMIDKKQQQLEESQKAAMALRRNSKAPTRRRIVSTSPPVREMKKAQISNQIHAGVNEDNKDDNIRCFPLRQKHADRLLEKQNGLASNTQDNDKIAADSYDTVRNRTCYALRNPPRTDEFHETSTLDLHAVSNPGSNSHEDKKADKPLDWEAYCKPQSATASHSDSRSSTSCDSNTCDNEPKPASSKPPRIEDVEQWFYNHRSEVAKPDVKNSLLDSNIKRLMAEIPSTDKIGRSIDSPATSTSNGDKNNSSDESEETDGTAISEFTKFQKQVTHLKSKLDNVRHRIVPDNEDVNSRDVDIAQINTDGDKILDELQSDLQDAMSYLAELKRKSVAKSELSVASLSSPTASFPPKKRLSTVNSSRKASEIIAEGLANKLLKSLSAKEGGLIASI